MLDLELDASGAQRRDCEQSAPASRGRWPAVSRLLLPWLLAWTACTQAEPWIAPGDASLRHDLQVLADRGIISAPVTTWPLSWGDVARGVLKADGRGLDGAEAAALHRVKRRLERETTTGELSPHVRVGVADDPRTLRTFEHTPRETAELEAGVRWTGLRLSYRLQGTVASNPDDGREFRADGSYLGVAFANWMFAAGVMERWWGPGWQGSLILSTNARPIPAVSLNRNLSEPFQARWLRWLGAWSASVVWGQLEGSRVVPDARFFGARVNFRPVPSLEIGVSRTAQWCGDGRPCDFDTFAELLAGQDNQGRRADEPGNQLAGVDVRWTGGPHGRRYALYGQFIGEDEANGMPAKYIGQLGAEFWGYSERLQGAYRFQVEAADTAASFYESVPDFDVAYEHGIYQTGYRFRGRSIGHALDNDGRMVSLGALLLQGSDRSWNLLLQVAELNRDGRADNRNTVSPVPADFLNLELGHQRSLGPGRIAISLGLERTENQQTGGEDNAARVLAQWNQEF